LPDLFAQILLFNFQQRFRVLSLKSGNEKAEETANEIREPLEHWIHAPFLSSERRFAL
jgi:hypothetical protein